MKENNDYPNIIPYEDTDNYDILKDDFCYSADGCKAGLKYAKENNGVFYTVVDGWGNKVDWFKGVIGCDRLGYIVVRIKGGLKNEF